MMQHNFRAFGVWGYVQGTLKCPTATSWLYDASTPLFQSSITSVTTQDQWVRTDEQIMAYIMRPVSIRIRLSIGRLTSSMEQ